MFANQYIMKRENSGSKRTNNYNSYFIAAFGIKSMKSLYIQCGLVALLIRGNSGEEYY